MALEESRKLFGKSLGANLRAARLARGLSQGQLGGSEFSVSYISCIERGKIEPSVLTLEILAHRLDLPSTQLLPNRDANPTEIEVDTTSLEAEIALLQDAIAEKVAYLNPPLTTNLLDAQQLLAPCSQVRAYLKSGQLEQVKHILFQAIKSGSELHTQYLMAQLFHLQARIYAVMGNYLQAISTASDCLALLEQVSPRNPLLLAQLRTDLGSYYMSLGETEKAIEQFQCVLSLTKGLAAPQNLQSLYWDLSLLYRQAGVYHLAILYAQKCLYLQSENRLCPSLRRSELYYYLGHALLKGDQEQAHAFLEEALQRPGVLQDQLASAIITVHLGKWLLIHARINEAEEYAQRALHMAQPFGDTPILAEALLTSGHVAYAHTRYEEGDAHILAALELLDRLQLYEEQMSASTDYAQLLEQSGREHDAIIYYKQAIECSQKVGREKR